MTFPPQKLTFHSVNTTHYTRCDFFVNTALSFHSHIDWLGKTRMRGYTNGAKTQVNIGCPQSQCGAIFLPSLPTSFLLFCPCMVMYKSYWTFMRRREYIDKANLVFAVGFLKGMRVKWTTRVCFAYLHALMKLANKWKKSQHIAYRYLTDEYT